MSQFPNFNTGQNIPQGLQVRRGSTSPMPLTTGVPAFNATPQQPQLSTTHSQSLAELHQRQQALLLQQQQRPPPVAMQQLQSQLARMTSAEREAFLAQAARMRPSAPGGVAAPQMQQAALQHQQHQQQARAIQSFMAATTAQQQQQQQQAPPLNLPPARSRTPQPAPVPVQQALPSTPQMSTRPSFGVATPPQMAQPLPQTQGSYHPSLLSTPPQSSSTPTRMPSPPRPPATARRPSVPITQAFTPASQPVQPPTRPGSPAESLKRKAPPEPYPRPQKRPVERAPNTPNAAPQVYFAGAGGKPKESSPVIDLSNENPVGDRRPSESQAPVTEVKRKRDERMRRTMRDDIARLMYACGDVIEPDVDTVDYVEDLVVDFLADLCRPSPLIRTNPQSTYQAHPLTAPILRHRLSSSPSLRKYLDRFDELSAKSVEIAAQRRMMRGTENPNDLVNIVGKDYLEVDEEGKEVGAAGEARKKRGRPRTKGVGEKDVKGVGRGRKKGNVMAKKIKPPASVKVE